MWGNFKPPDSKMIFVSSTHHDQAGIRRFLKNHNPQIDHDTCEKYTELQDLVNRILRSDRTRRVDKGTQQGKDLIHLTNTHTHIISSCQGKIKELA